MPIYEYECKDCGRSYTARRSVDSRDEPLDCIGGSCRKEGTMKRKRSLAARVWAPTRNGQ